MLMVTFLATLALGIEEGIGIGVLMSLVLVIYSSSKPHSTELGRLGESGTFRNINRYEEAQTTEDVLLFRFDAPLYFANVDHFRQSIDDCIESHGEMLNLIILDASSINFIDSTGVHTLHKLVDEMREKEISFYISGAIGPVRDKLKRSGIVEKMGRHTFFFDLDQGLKYYHEKIESNHSKAFSPLQTNV